MDISQIVEGGIYEIKPQNEGRLVGLDHVIVAQIDGIDNKVWVIPRISPSIFDNRMSYCSSYITLIDTSEMLKELGLFGESMLKEIKLVANDLLQKSEFR